MRALMRVTTTDQGQMVDTRKPWRALDIRQEFIDWFKQRIERGGLKKDSDFEVFHRKVKNPLSGGSSTDFALTLDSVKHICLMFQTDMGKKIRAYFIKIEKPFLPFCDDLVRA